MKLIFVSLFLMVNIIISSQSLINLYQSEIPEQLLAEESSKEKISTNLEFYSELHPELVAYYVIFLNEYIQSDNEQKRENVINAFLSLRQKYYSKREFWSEKQLEGITNLSDDYSVDEKYTIPYKNYLGKNSDTSQKRISFINDDNYFEYLLHIYFLREQSKYDTQADYKAANEKYIQEHISSLNNDFKQLDDLSDDSRKVFLDKLNSEWYFCGDQGFNKHNHTTDFESSDILEIILKNKYQPEGGLYLSISNINFLSGNSVSSGSLVYSITPKTYDDYKPPKLTEAKVEFIPDFHFSAGYKLQIREDNGLLSFIDLGASIIVSRHSASDNNQGLSYSSRFERDEFDDAFLYTYSLMEFEFDDQNMYSAHIFIPVWFFGRKISIETGAVYNYHSCSVKYKTLKEKLGYVRPYGFITPLGEEILIDEYSETNGKITPALRLRLEVFKGLSIAVTSSQMFDKFVTNLDLTYLVW